MMNKKIIATLLVGMFLLICITTSASGKETSITEDDIRIRIYGSLHCPKEWNGFRVIIYNDAFPSDTAQLDIRITIKDIWTDKELNVPFEKKLIVYQGYIWGGGPNINGFRFCSITVTVDGYDDDVGLHIEKSVYGLIIQDFILLFSH
jgi:hypothetical protein